MEDRKSLSCNNQVENYKKDFQCSGNVIENGSHSRLKQYRRDVMLQLRLHPLSLQKPRDLPDMEIVKDKLYLHSITDSSSSGDRYIDLSSYQTSLKPEYCNMKHEYSLLPHHFNRMYPYCFPPHLYNGPYQNTSSKFRSLYHTYCNSLKKHCMANHSHTCHKDLPEECVWAKRCYPSSEDIWSCYPNNVNTSFIKKKENIEAIPKSRKKLSIIDPVTGKNILEAVTAIPSEKQSDVYAAEGNSECSENCNGDTTEGKYAGDYFCNTEEPDERPLHVSSEEYQDTVLCSSEDKVYYEKLKDVDTMYQTEFFNKRLEENSNYDETFKNKITIATDCGKGVSANAKDEIATSTIDPTSTDGNANKVIKNYENIQDISEVNKILHKQEPKTLQNKEANGLVDVHGNCQAHYKKQCNLQFSKESLSKQSDSMRDSIKQLREKIYSLRQEQQKMAILQSFLRYKKYQLEESARNLDEKRIEIANWECNLFTKAKRLHDKEHWLDSKSEVLYNKAQQLAEREKILNKEEKKVLCEANNTRSDNKETQFTEKKLSFDHCSNTAWEEIPVIVKNIYRSEESNDYTYFTCGSNPIKITESSPSNVEKCKSDACSLDELEMNIAFIEKMNSNNEAGDTNLENKTELAAVKRKEDNTPCDPLGYSKGRRYLPEHIKYWLNKRDKNAL